MGSKRQWDISRWSQANPIRSRSAAINGPNPEPLRTANQEFLTIGMKPYHDRPTHGQDRQLSTAGQFSNGDTPGRGQREQTPIDADVSKTKRVLDVPQAADKSVVNLARNEFQELNLAVAGINGAGPPAIPAEPQLVQPGEEAYPLAAR